MCVGGGVLGEGRWHNLTQTHALMDFVSDNSEEAEER